ncbi:hypothetical protein AA0119_g2561 [Alternaria tenuissima]|uniref:Uncharacterized protein n=1 Tax=Alternaria tenuissima TaxID=119927 RepID=A0AB37WJY1_9PLEO|nr:hypothetical protein AA0115_g6085 [Alternaria tenuissima]RYO06607.1 hypothetical protein AA0119_g2561 [Alternaria tenuissima]
MGDMANPLPYAVNPLPFAGKVIAVTGASRGLGLALSKYLLIRGATVSNAPVSMCATSADNLSNAAKEIDGELPDAKGRYWTCIVDIANLDSVRSWIEETVAKFGKLDGAANVAAVEQREIFPITDLDPEYFARLVNYATYGTSAYVAAKHALIGLTKVAAFEGASRRVRVNALCPGCFNTPMMTEPFNSSQGQFFLNKDNIPCILKRELPETWEIAGSIAFLLGDEAAHVTKASWFVDGGWTEGTYSSG